MYNCFFFPTDTHLRHDTSLPVHFVANVSISTTTYFSLCFDNRLITVDVLQRQRLLIKYSEISNSTEKRDFSIISFLPYANPDDRYTRRAYLNDSEYFFYRLEYFKTLRVTMWTTRRPNRHGVEFTRCSIISREVWTFAGIIYHCIDVYSIRL